MKVLLIGEYSGVHVNLKKGLAKTHPEVQVTLVSNGDRFKNFDRDIDIRGYESNLYLYTATRLIKELNFILQSDKFYDVIQIINPDIFSRFLPLQWVYKILRKKCNKFILLAAGDDYYFLEGLS